MKLKMDKDADRDADRALWSPVQAACSQSSTGVHTSGTRIGRSYCGNVGTQPHLEVRRAMRPRVPRVPQIVALGGGGFSMEQGNPLLDDYVLSLTGAKRPRVCFLPTASGDADHYVVRFYRRFSPGCEASHVSLFRRDQGTGGVEDDLATHLLAQDLIYVGGGNVVSMLGAWRAHGLDAVLRQAWRKGVVLCGPSAGSLCWFAESLSAFHGAPRRVRGLGPAALLQLRPLRRRARAARRVPPLRRRRDAPRLRRRGRRRAALPPHASGAGRQLPPRRVRLPRRAGRRRRRRNTAGDDLPRGRRRGRRHTHKGRQARKCRRQSGPAPARDSDRRRVSLRPIPGPVAA